MSIFENPTLGRNAPRHSVLNSPHCCLQLLIPRTCNVTTSPARLYKVACCVLLVTRRFIGVRFRELQNIHSTITIDNKTHDHRIFLLKSHKKPSAVHICNSRNTLHTLINILFLYHNVLLH